MSVSNSASLLGDIPVGIIIPHAGNQPIPNYLKCDGSSYLISDYPELYTVIRGIYGQVDSEHFNVPNVVGRLMGASATNANTQTNNSTDVSGNLGFTVTEANMPYLPDLFYNYTSTNAVGQGYGGLLNASVSTPVEVVYNPNQSSALDIQFVSGSTATANIAQEEQVTLNVITDIVASYTGTGTPVSTDISGNSTTQLNPKGYIMNIYIKALPY